MTEGAARAPSASAMTSAVGLEGVATTESVGREVDSYCT